jgi:hypothetical protein
MVQQPLFNLGTGVAVREGPDPLEETLFRDRANLVREGDARVQVPDHAHGQHNLEREEPPLLSFKLGQGNAGDDGKVPVELVVGYNENRPAVAGLLTAYVGLQVRPEQVPSVNRSKIGHQRQAGWLSSVNPSPTAGSKARSISSISAMYSRSAAACAYDAYTRSRRVRRCLVATARFISPMMTTAAPAV